MIAIPTLHPAALLRSSEEVGTARFQHVVVHDLQRAAEMRHRKPNWDEAVIWETRPGVDGSWKFKNLFPRSVEEIYEFCRRADGKLLAPDVETTGDQPMACDLICLGLASESGAAINIPFLRGGGNYTRYWTPGDERRVREAIGWLLLDSKTPKVFQNGSFDTTVLWKEGMPVLGWKEDCYSDEETEFLTDHGWLKYDQINQSHRLGTVAKDGSLAFQHFFNRVSKSYIGKMLVFETQHTRAVVTPNHRMWCAPTWRGSGRIDQWQFIRADQLAIQSPDTYTIQTAGRDNGTYKSSIKIHDLEITEDFATFIGLFITDGCLTRAKNKIDAGSVRITQKLNGRASAELHRLVPLLGLSVSSRIAKPNGFRSIAIVEEIFSLCKKSTAMVLEELCGRYSKHRRLPRFALDLPVNLRKALFKGLLLGDASEVDCGTEFRSMSPGLAGDMQALGLSLGYTATVHKAGGCLGVKFNHKDGWTTKLLAREKVQISVNRDGSPKNRGHISTIENWVGRIVCFSVPNETLVTRSHGKPAFYGNTMQAHHVLDGEMPHNLAFIASSHLEVPFWKDEVKGDLRWLDLDPVILRSYNLRDCLTTLRALPPMLAEIKRLGLEKLYRKEIKLCHVMRKASWRGIEVDLDRRDSEQIVDEAMLASPLAAKLGVGKSDLGQRAGLGPRMRDLRAQALGEMQSIAGNPEFKPTSPPQLASFLYERLKFPVVSRSDKTNKPSTDKNALVLLGIHADTPDQKRALSALIKFRKADKILGTWVEGLPILNDNRLHVSWKLLPVTGRFSSSPNAQNWNYRIKRIFRAGEGNKFVSVDLSQAELRQIAYYSGDPELLEMYEKGINIHTVNTALFFGVRCPPEAHKDTNQQTEEYLKRKIPEWIGAPYESLPTVNLADPKATASAWKSMRTLSKNGVFSANYSGGPETAYELMRAKRDDSTDEVLFPDLELGQVEAVQHQWLETHPWIQQYWARICDHVQRQGFYRSPLSGRIRWFRAGFKRQEIVNFGIQEAIAAHMERIIQVHDYLEEATGDEAVVNMQVHDMVNIESPDKHVETCKDILRYVFNEPFNWNPPDPFPKYPNAVLPADEPTVGVYLDQI